MLSLDETVVTVMDQAKTVHNRLGSISKLNEFTVGPLATELFSKGLIHAARLARSVLVM